MIIDDKKNLKLQNRNRPHLFFVGCGAMGEAVLDLLLRKGILEKSDITIAEKNPARLTEIKEKYSVKTIQPDDIKCPKEADKINIVFLAVKPQNAGEALKKLKNLRFELLITILAGVKCGFFNDGIPDIPVLRVMPNLAIRVGKSVSALYANNYFRQSPLCDIFTGFAEKIFGACGEILWASDEDMLDKITALSGSGPAYVCFFLEAFAEAAKRLGFAQKDALHIALKTFEGAIEYLNASGGITPEELRKKVTSPGGTTEKAISYFEKKDLKKIIDGGIRSAYKRAKDLGKE